MNSELKEMETPSKVYISLSQHLGAPATPVVAVGDYVKAGSLIGQASAFMSANVYSSISGKVTGISKRVTATNMKVDHIEIENDFKYEKIILNSLENEECDTIIERKKLAGIVGMGGATFPTHIKLKPSKPVDVLIINGAECEPYITCDYRLFLECTDEIIGGIKLLMKALKVKECFIGIEKNKPQVIEKLKPFEKDNIKVIALETKYPQGAEKQLIYAITERKVIAGGLPMDVGCVVDNVHTAYCVYKACIKGEPCYMRAMTVSGKGIDKPSNLWVRTGVTYEDVYKYCSNEDTIVNNKKNYEKIISGGPMMGFAQPNLNATVGKGTSSILFLTEDEINNKPISACINCGRCAMSCPMNLMPMMIERSVIQSDKDNMNKYNIMSCIECGSCAYSCPAGRQLIQSIRLGKKMLKEKK
jgi:electron transport complex protein RnfC